jgi:hypothetical protein
MKQKIFWLVCWILWGGALATAVPHALADDPPFLVFLPLVQRPAPTSTIMPNDAQTLALLALDGNTQDMSGHGRHAILISGTFTTTAVGQGLHLTGEGGEAGQGFHWNAYADLLVHPYTIEMIVTPEETQSYRKLFSFDDSSDRGWYYRSEGLAAYPHQWLGEGLALPNEQHYLAFVSLDNETIEVYLQGVSIGTTEASFAAPVAQAIFFNDDAATGRVEQLAGVVEEVRISGMSRTAVEIQAIQASR